jgi:micrococcal nuclease
VKLVTDPQETDRDKYDRLLRYIYLEDGTMINERLVYEGYAFAYEAYPTGRTKILKAMEDDARKNNRGLWGGCQATIKNNGKSKSTQSVKD